MSCMAAGAWGQQSSSSPQGEKKEYVKTFSGCFYTSTQDEFEGREKKATIIWGEDNEVYFPDIISMQPMGSITKGTLEGDQITVEIPQTVHHQVDDFGFMVIEMDYNLVLLKESVANGMKTYTPIKDPGSVTFTLQADGAVVLNALEEGYALGLTQNNGFSEDWYGAAEYSMVYTPKGEDAFDPKTLEKTSYSYITTGNGGQSMGEADFGYKVKVGFHDNDVYFFNICPEYPDWWFKGRLEGTQVVVDNNQPMGNHAGAFDASLVFGKSDDSAPLGYSLLPAETQFVFNYDAEKKIFTSATPEVVMFVNCIPDQLTYFLTKVADPTFVYQDTAAGTPLNPWGLSFFFDEFGAEPETQGYLGVNLPIVSTEGILLNRDNMYYNIYLDGEKIEFTKSEYGMAEDDVNVPYLFMGNGISAQKFSTTHQIRLKPEGKKIIGVGLVNVYDGIAYESDVVEISISYSSIEINEATSAKVVDEIFYDLSGRRISDSSKGLVVKKTLLDNGTVKVEKTFIK